jgi:hypothetical protein
MAEKDKRLDIQFGSFACSVQGFDDPVVPVQQVLQALQNLLEEMPELADASISFDSAAIDRLMGEVARRADIDEENVEIVPGLIIVHRSDAVAGRPREQRKSEDQEVWSRPFPADDAPADEIAREEPDEEPGYVNIFASASGGEYSHAEEMGEGPAEEETYDDESFGARLRAAAEDELEGAEETPAADIFADIGDTSGGVFADPMNDSAEAEEQDEEEGYTSLNFFSASGREENGAAGISKAADHANLFSGPGAEEEDRESASVELLFGNFAGHSEQPRGPAEEKYTAAKLAKRAGVDTVPELMVSAAAWMVLLQGQTSFTRKDVIKVFETIPGDHPNTLEARIKGFGKAVRNGQLIMIEDGVFGLARTELDRFQSLL